MKLVSIFIGNCRSGIRVNCKYTRKQDITNVKKCVLKNWHFHIFKDTPTFSWSVRTSGTWLIWSSGYVKCSALRGGEQGSSWIAHRREWGPTFTEKWPGSSSIWILLESSPIVLDGSWTSYWRPLEVFMFTLSNPHLPNVLPSVNGLMHRLDSGNVDAVVNTTYGRQVPVITSFSFR